MEFFDDEPVRPRHENPDPGPQTVWGRRAVAIGAALLIFLLVVFGIRGCLNARENRSIKNYVTDSSELVKQSVSIGDDFFALLKKPGDATPLDLKNQFNSYKVDAQKTLERAEKLDPPDDLKQANKWLIASLELREQGLREVARLIRSALSSKNGSKASDRIAGEMQVFLASDVIYLRRFVPDVEKVLQGRGIDDVKVSEARFLTDINWLLADTVSDRLALVEGKKAATPGLHGVGLVKVTAQPSGSELVEGQSTNIKISAKLSFIVEVQNQGDSEETDVLVRLQIAGANDIDVEKTIRRIAQGETKTVTIPLSAKPKAGATTLKVRVEPVAGEKLTDNNKADYPIEFER